MFSQTLRRIYSQYYQIELGWMAYGPGLKPGNISPGTKIGKFVSIAEGVITLRRNHPTQWLSQHPMFFNAAVGFVDQDRIPGIRDNPLRIGHDAWLGLNAIICPGCQEIGDGAIVAAGAVVTRNVEAFTIVGGNPARLIRRRYEPEVEKLVRELAWWHWSPEQLLQNAELLTGELSAQRLRDLSQIAARSRGKASVNGGADI